mgnify:CR=1 FL=1
MVMLTTLADVARGAGLHVREVAGWQHRGHGEMDDDIRTITCHHTAGPTARRDPSTLARAASSTTTTPAWCGTRMVRSSLRIGSRRTSRRCRTEADCGRIE